MYNNCVNTIVETPIYLKHVQAFWTESEREQFVVWMSDNPDSGDVIPGTRGLRKVRYARAGMGKRGGVRVIYLVQSSKEQTLLLAAYTKTEQDNLSITFLQSLAKLYGE
jgi:mRNA-degrading endonuclease RelE of RelBE toxin-antitoxin system